MSRNYLIVIFLFVLVLSLSLFLRKDSLDRWKNLKKEHESYLNLYNFKYYKYSGVNIIKYMEGGKAALATIDRVELYGNIKGWRLLNQPVKKKEILESSFVHANLNTKHLLDFQNVVTVTGALFGGGVSIMRENLIMYTKEAQYLGSVKNRVVGTDPVHAKLKNQSIEADKGFQLDLEKGSIDLFGPIKGVINPNEK
jgi:hypothetical protein